MKIPFDKVEDIIQKSSTDIEFCQLLHKLHQQYNSE